MSLIKAVGVSLLFFSGIAEAGSVLVGLHDVETVFFINKSDDHNRVDYGIRLDPNCHPVSSDDSVFYYWREFENAPPVRIHDANFLDRLAYGISSQSQKMSEYSLRLKRLNRDIVIRTAQSENKICAATAFMQISGVHDARLYSAYVKLAGLMSVEYIEIHGADPTTGVPLLERIVN